MPPDDDIKILLVEDSPTATIMVEYWLSDGLRSPFELCKAQCLCEAKKHLAEKRIDLIVLDLNLPDSAGLATFRQVLACANGAAIVIVSGESDEEIAIQAVREGAQDYIVKGSDNVNRLARPVSFALERVRHQRVEAALHEAERKMDLARDVQRELFPKTPPELPGFEIHGRSQPSDKTGGDYFDFVPMSDDSHGIVIGDVCGHGIASTLLMVETRAVLRVLSRTLLDLGQILTMANDIVCADMDWRFATLFFGRIDPKRRMLSYSSAGHRSYLLKAGSKECKSLTSVAPPLGVMENCPYIMSEEHQLDPGDLLLLFTDGITETRAPNLVFFGEQRMLDVVVAHRERSAAEIVEAVFQAVGDFSGDGVQQDDRTMVAVKAI